MTRVTKMITELKTGEVFDWLRIGGHWKVSEIDTRNAARSNPAKPFVSFWFESIVKPGEEKRYMQHVKGLDKDETVEVIS
jgi:hypothetical protein